MTIATEVQSLAPSALIEMFVLDTTNIPNGELLRFHAGTNQLQQSLVWQGQTYSPLPIEAEGFDVSTQGTLPRPKIRVANVQGMFSAIVREGDDLVNCKVIRKRTFAKYLDAVNFPGGVNPTADANQYFPDDIWYVERKTSENRYVIEWELSSAFDLQGVMLPRRQVIQGTCMSRYRSSECSYVGSLYFDASDLPTTADKDVCGKRLHSCELRNTNGILPYGGFPGSTRNG